MGGIGAVCPEGRIGFLTGDRVVRGLILLGMFATLGASLVAVGGRCSWRVAVVLGGGTCVVAGGYGCWRAWPVADPAVAPPVPVACGPGPLPAIAAPQRLEPVVASHDLAATMGGRMASPEAVIQFVMLAFGDGRHVAVASSQSWSGPATYQNRPCGGAPTTRQIDVWSQNQLMEEVVGQMARRNSVLMAVNNTLDGGYDQVVAADRDGYTLGWGAQQRRMSWADDTGLQIVVIHTNS